jgi:hypothetical protein
MADADFDYLALEPLLVARLRAEVSGVKAVQGLSDLASLSSKQQITPAIYVIYLGDIVGNVSGNAQPTDQVWAVVPTVYYADAGDTGEGARRIAGPLITRTLGALGNWRPRLDMKPLKRMQSSTPAEYDAGFGYFPLLFTSGFVFIPNRSPAS